MLMYNVIKYKDNYLKKPRNLLQCCRDGLAVNGNVTIVDFNEANVTKVPNFKSKIFFLIQVNQELCQKKC